MKTAREILYKEMDKGDPLYEEDSIRLMKEYAKEAIKADREGLLNHITASLYRSENDERMDSAIVDKDSIINAPQIELL